jgi:hypothetical protein
MYCREKEFVVASVHVARGMNRQARAGAEASSFQPIPDRGVQSIRHAIAAETCARSCVKKLNTGC